MERALVFRKISGGEAVRVDHVRFAVQHHADHLRGRLGGVGVVAVRNQVAVRVDVAEHAADHVALSLPVFVPDDGPGLFCQPRRAVRRVVVVHIDVGFRQGGPVVPHDFPDGFGLVVTWNQYGDSAHLLPLPSSGPRAGPEGGRRLFKIPGFKPISAHYTIPGRGGQYRPPPGHLFFFRRDDIIRCDAIAPAA